MLSNELQSELSLATNDLGQHIRFLASRRKADELQALARSLVQVLAAHVPTENAKRAISRFKKEVPE